MNNKNIGKIGEDTACAMLKEKGYEILKRNYRCREGEIDIICAKDQRICFIEVKTRQSDIFGLPKESVTRDKQNTIRRVAMHYLKNDKNDKKFYGKISFSVFEVFLNHIENAF